MLSVQQWLLYYRKSNILLKSVRSAMASSQNLDDEDLEAFHEKVSEIERQREKMDTLLKDLAVAKSLQLNEVEARAYDLLAR